LAKTDICKGKFIVVDYVDSHYARTRVELPAWPELDGDVIVDVCVIGAGLAGLNTALTLAEMGKSVCILEAKRVGWGASGRNGGFVGAGGYSRELSSLIKLLGLGEARALHDLSREGWQKVRQRIEQYAMPGITRKDGILIASWFNDDDDLRQHRDFMAKNFDREYKFFDQQQMSDLISSPRYFGGLLDEEGFQFHPLNYCIGVAKAASDLGVKVCENSPATGLNLKGGEKQIMTPKGRVRAQNIVFTMGGYQDGLQGKLNRAMLPIATYVTVTEPLGDNRLKEAIRVPYAIGDTKFASDYYRPLDDTRILWGGRISARLTEPADLKALMIRDLTKIYPQLEGVQAEVAWMGTMSYAGHKMPQIGSLGPGIWYGQAFGGSGMATTSMAGLLLAEAITGSSDRYKHFERFGIRWAGGDLGRLAAQMVYWGLQIGDAWRVATKN